MVTVYEDTTFYVRLVNNLYKFYNTKEDRDNDTNAISEEIHICKGALVFYDLNHTSQTGHRLVFTVADATHSNICSNFVEGVTDFSKLIFDQGGFGKVTDLKEWKTNHFDYLGDILVFSSAIFAPNVRSSVPIKLIPKIVKINVEKKRRKRKYKKIN